MERIFVFYSIRKISLALAIFAACASTFSLRGYGGEKTLRMTAVGDSGWIGGVKKYVDKLADDYDKREFKRRISAIHTLPKSDLTFTNVEATLTTTCETMREKTHTFTMGPESLKGFIREGFNLLSLANNHSADCISPSSNDQIYVVLKQMDNLAPKFIAHGVASDESSLMNINSLQVKNLEVGLIAIKGWFDPKHPYIGSLSNYKKLFKKISSKQLALRILSIHAGVERSRIVEPHIKKLAREFLNDFGGHVVFIHHTHTYSGVELLKNKRGQVAAIFWGLGNFFHNGLNGFGGDGMIASFSFSTSKGVHNLSLIPLKSNTLEIDFASEKSLIYFEEQIRATSDANIAQLSSPYQNLERLKFSTIKNKYPIPSLKIAIEK